MTFQSGKNEFAETTVLTLEDLMARISVAPSLNDRQRRDISSALNTVGRWHQRPLSEIPATHQYLRDFFESANFGSLGVSRGRMRNVCSLLKQALAVSDVPTSIRKDLVPIIPEWRELRNKIDNRHDRDCFGRFARFCSGRGIDPAVVDDTVVALYRTTLAEEDLVAKPDAAAQAVVRVWNRVAKGQPDWPQTRLTPVLHRESYTLRWDEVPGALVTELEAYLAILGGADPMDHRSPPRPLKPRSISKRRYEFRQLISGMKHQGVPIGNLQKLADLCDPERVKKGLTFFILRHKQRHGADSSPATSSMIAGIADAVRALAKYYVDASPPVIAELTRIANRLNRRQRGLTEKNRARLAQLDSLPVERKFLLYPLIEMEKLVNKNSITPRDAVRYGVLLAIQILIFAPMRSENVAELDLQQHFVWPPRRRGEIGIVIPRKNVKNSVPLDFKIPVAWAAFFYRYLDRFRPLLVKNGSTALFPNPRGRSKRPDTVSKQIANLIRKELGIRWNAHIFRHLAARLYKRAYPHDYEGLRRLLAHLSIETTVQSYEGGDMRPAVDRYDALLESQLGPIPRGTELRRRRGVDGEK